MNNDAFPEVYFVLVFSCWKCPALKTHTLRSDRAALGISMTMLGGLCFAIQDAGIKWLSAELAVLQILFVRSLFGLAMLAAAAFSGGATWICLRYVGQKLAHCNEAVALRLPVWFPFTSESWCFRPGSGVPEWLPLTVLPLALFIMTARFIALALKAFRGEEVLLDEAAEAARVGESMAADEDEEED